MIQFSANAIFFCDMSLLICFFPLPSLLFSVFAVVLEESSGQLPLVHFMYPQCPGCSQGIAATSGIPHVFDAFQDGQKKRLQQFIYATHCRMMWQWLLA